MPPSDIQTDFLKDIFYIPANSDEQGDSKLLPLPPIPPAQPQHFNNFQYQWGISINLTEVAKSLLPIKANISVAYDIRSGNPFTKYTKLDFEIQNMNCKIKNGTAKAIAGNIIQVNAKKPNFYFSITALIPKRFSSFNQGVDRMKRHINYTNRKKIEHNKIILKKINDNNVPYLDASVDFSNMNLPNNAAVYLEAYHGAYYARFSFGTIGTFNKPENTKLEALGDIDQLHFRIKVVDESSKRGLILAEASGLVLEGSETAKSILPIQFIPLENEVWKVSFIDDRPILQLNKNIPHIMDKAVSDYRFFFYIYPAVIREILTWLIFVYGISDIEDTESWERDWLAFANRFGGIQPSCINNKANEFDIDETIQWIDRIVTGFCQSQYSKWANLIEIEEGGQ